ncbi:MAG TPA: hypothetical protein VEK55_03065, partial [Xanthobacteraceae bacterium]|nr:hypothetical protein [Xanthobacteraceae bacterium]
MGIHGVTAPQHPVARGAPLGGPRAAGRAPKNAVAARYDGDRAPGPAMGMRGAVAAGRSRARAGLVTCRTGFWAKVDEDDRAIPGRTPAPPGSAR